MPLNQFAACRLMMFEERRGRRVICFSAALFLLTAIGKMLTVGRGDVSLHDADPLFQIPRYALLILSSIVEFVVVVVLLSRASTRTKFYVLGWLSGNIMLYRISYALLAPGSPCNCLGSPIADLFPISRRSMDTLLVLATAVICVHCFGFIYKTGSRPAQTLSQEAMSAREGLI